MKLRAYVYPISAFGDRIIPNPYLDNLMDSLSEYFDFVNRENPSSKGILDIASYVNKLDYIFLNWIEDIPDKKGGFMQVLFFITLVRLLKWKKIRLIWTMHNKLSHYKSNLRLKRYLFRFLIRNCDFILTHSTEGIRYAVEYKEKRLPQKIKFLPHPLENRFIEFKENPDDDILIWGSVIPYKNIDGFLEYLHMRGFENKYKIRIIGKVKPDSYERVIQSYCNNAITLENRYIPDEILTDLVANSKIILCTHAGESVLSSGALMDSLSFGATVIGPDLAAFKDARNEGLITTYQTFEQLVLLLDQALLLPRKMNNNLQGFIEKNNWSQFAKQIMRWIITY
jgi:beta-1,4-mannosyltransferase